MHLRTKLFRGNQNPYVKAVDILNYNLVVKINNECKIEYFDKLNVKTATKPFWKTCKPCFSTEARKGHTAPYFFVAVLLFSRRFFFFAALYFLRCLRGNKKIRRQQQNKVARKKPKAVRKTKAATKKN